MKLISKHSFHEADLIPTLTLKVTGWPWPTDLGSSSPELSHSSRHGLDSIVKVKDSRLVTNSGCSCIGGSNHACGRLKFTIIVERSLEYDGLPAIQIISDRIKQSRAEALSWFVRNSPQPLIPLPPLLTVCLSHPYTLTQPLFPTHIYTCTSPPPLTSPLPNICTHNQLPWPPPPPQHTHTHKVVLQYTHINPPHLYEILRSIEMRLSWAKVLPQLF